MKDDVVVEELEIKVREYWLVSLPSLMPKTGILKTPPPGPPSSSSGRERQKSSSSTSIRSGRRLRISL